MKIKRNLKRGVTLVEILLYFAMVSALLLIIINFSFRIFDTTQKTRNANELAQGAQLIVQRIVEAARLADVINVGYSEFGTDTGTISFDMPSGYPDPTVFSIANGEILLTEGLSDPAVIHSDRISCTKLRFTQIANSKAPDQLIIEGSCESAIDGNAAVQDSFDFKTAVSLR